MKIWVRALCSPESRPSRNGRVGRDRQQQRQHRAQAIAHQHRAVGAADADVDVHRERVVAPRDVLQPVLDAAVVLGLDDLLLAVVRPRMGAGGPERDVLRGGQREQPPAQVALGGPGGGEVLTAAGADLDLGGDQLARRSTRASTASSAAASRSSLEARRPARGSRDRARANSSSSPTVKSVEASKAARAVSRSSSTLPERVRYGARSDRSTARRADRPRGSRCGRSPRAGPGAGRRSS